MADDTIPRRGLPPRVLCVGIAGFFRPGGGLVRAAGSSSSRPSPDPQGPHAALDGSTWVFVASPNSGLAGLQLAIDGSGNPSLVGKWTVTGGCGGAVIANSVLYYPKGSSIFALSPTTGAQLWSAAIGGVHFQSPIVANGVVYITDNGSNLTAFSLTSVGSRVPASNAGAVLGLGALLVGLGLRRIVVRRKGVARAEAI